MRALNLIVFAFSFMALISAQVLSAGAADKREKAWGDLKEEFFENVEIADGSALLSIEAPTRAHDAAVVPVKITAKPGTRFKRLVLFVDENPIPMAADFSFGKAAPTASFSTRVRVNSYSYIRAVAEADDGKHYMVKTFVKASGGCSAPASKDLAAAKAQIGRMKLRFFKPAAPASSTPQQSGLREAQIMIRHPNTSGFQMDQVTMLYIPAHYVDHIEVRQGEDLVMKVEGGISLSEDPNLRFFYRDTGKGEITVNASDNEDGKFSRSWPITGS
ncbi:MAG: quinoprotein dehydrogenase-associated SoxYZ-like carrier [Rhizobiales bacterium]|nr:quinoprotein dehydrogenase-associated SoxYZ-like carrier [Hyphomicrobiales bacterium]